MASFKEVNVSFDFIGVSTDTKPVNVPEGSIAYEVDTKKKFVFYNDTWYEM